MELDLEVLGSAVQHSAGALLVTDADGIVTWANEAAHRLTGYTHQELLGVKPGRLLQCEQTDPQAVARIRRALAERRSVTVDLLNRRKDGAEYWARLMIHPWSDAAGAHRGFYCLQADITAELALASRGVNAQERAQSLFSHQLRTPLHAVIHLLQHLKDEVSTEAARQMADHALQASEHLLDLVDEVLGGEAGPPTQAEPGVATRTQGPEAADGPARRSYLASGADHTLSGVRLLLVDDNPVGLLAGALSLRKAGAWVAECISGAAALEFLDQQGRSAVDVVLMDLHMPGMDGFETARQIRQLSGPGLPLLAVTASVTEADRVKALAAGMREVVTKPFAVADLARAVQRVRLASAPARAAH